MNKQRKILMKHLLEGLSLHEEVFHHQKKNERAQLKENRKFSLKVFSRFCKSM